MVKIGQFLYRNFLDKEVMLYTGDQNDWFKYQDNDSMAYVLIVGVVTDYDDECGILTMESKNKENFYIAEDSISMFWLADSTFKLVENTTSTIRSGKKWLGGKVDRDIM